MARFALQPQKVDLLLLLVVFLLRPVEPLPGTSCYNYGDNTYRGEIDKTATNRTCINWDHPGIKAYEGHDASKWPGKMKKLLQQIEGLDGNTSHNFCRNMGQWSENRPWCFTSDAIEYPYNSYPGIMRSGICNIPFCNKNYSTCYEHLHRVGPGNQSTSTAYWFDIATGQCRNFSNDGYIKLPNLYITKDECENHCPVCNTTTERTANITCRRTTTANGDNFALPGGKCNFTCPHGYGNTHSYITTCVVKHNNTTPRWVNDEGMLCSPVRCPKKLAHGQLAPSCNDTRMGEKCNYTCEQGYSKLVDGTLTCGSDSKWSHVDEFCQKEFTTQTTKPPEEEHQDFPLWLIPVMIIALLLLLFSIVAFGIAYIKNRRALNAKESNRSSMEFDPKDTEKDEGANAENEGAVDVELQTPNEEGPTTIFQPRTTVMPPTQIDEERGSIYANDPRMSSEFKTKLPDQRTVTQVYETITEQDENEP